MNKSNKATVVFLIIFILSTISLGGYIVYDKILNEKLNSKEEVKQNDETTIKTQNISVEEAVNYIDEYYKLFQVRLPKVVGDTENIEKLNGKILNEILPSTYSYGISHAEINRSMDKGSSIDYDYIIKDDILVIYIYTTIPDGGTAIPATGGGLIRASYYYDISNDKMLTLSETAEIFKLNIDNLHTSGGTKINSYKELENSGEYIIAISNSDLELEFLL